MSIDAAEPEWGSSRGLAELYRKHHRGCLRTARRVVVDPQLAEDVVHDVFLMLWQTQGGAYRAERGPIEPWLHRVVHHKAVDVVRRSEARRRTVAAEAPGRFLDASVHDEAWAAARVRLLLSALAVLPAQQQQVLRLAYGEGLTQRQIAARTGVALGTVKTRTRSGLLRLRAELQGPLCSDPT